MIEVLPSAIVGYRFIANIFSVVRFRIHTATNMRNGNIFTKSGIMVTEFGNYIF